MSTGDGAFLINKLKGGNDLATKLKGLNVGKVDFVDQGANQRADIKIIKNKDGEEAQNPEIGFFKRFLNWVTGELSKPDSEIAKSATTFNEQINAVSMDAIRDEIWSTCYALQNSLNSILCDAEMDSSAKQAAMETSTEQFAEAMKGYIPNWASGTATNIRKNLATPDETDLQMVMKAHKNLTDIIEKSSEDNEKGELEDMLKINKSKMTAEERAAYDELIKKYAVETEEQVGKSAPKAEDPDIVDDSGVTKTQKSVTPPPASPTTETSTDTGDDIYKGLHPAVRARLEALEKRAAEAEERELLDVAKKYEIIGEKPEELVKTLKSLKAAGGTAYNDMIGILDRNIAMVEKSGVFSEIGKSFSNSSAAYIKKSAAESKIDTIAKGYMEKDSALTYNAALAKAWEDHPELLDEYEVEAGY